MALNDWLEYYNHQLRPPGQQQPWLDQTQPRAYPSSLDFYFSGNQPKSNGYSNMNPRDPAAAPGYWGTPEPYTPSPAPGYWGAPEPYTPPPAPGYWPHGPTLPAKPPEPVFVKPVIPPTAPYVPGDPRVSMPPGGLPAAAPSAAPVESGPTAADLQKLLLQAQIDNLTSTGNAKAPDYSGLEAAAAEMKPNKWESLMRFGFATAGGDSPHFGVNVGRGGVAMLDARDAGLARYNTAMANIAQLQETARSNIARERTAAIEVAKPDPVGERAVDPITKSILATQEKLWEQRREAILDNPMLQANPEETARLLNELEAERANFYAGLGGYVPNGDLVDVSD